METALVRRARRRDQSSGSEDGFPESDINGYPKVKSRGWRPDPYTEGAAYGRHQVKIERIKHSAVEDVDDDEDDNDNDNNAGADTESRRPKESQGGHRERGRHSSPVRENNPHAYTHGDPHRPVTITMVMMNVEFGLGEAVQSEHRNDSRNPQVGDSRSRHQTIERTSTVREHSPSPAQQTRPLSMLESLGISRQSSSPAPICGTSASDQHPEQDPSESTKDADEGSTASEHEMQVSSKGDSEGVPALPLEDEGFASGPSSNTDSPIPGNDQERSNGKVKGEGHGKSRGKGHGSSGSGYSMRGVDETNKGIAWVRPKREHGSWWSRKKS